MFTIDVSGQRAPEHFTNSGYVSTESTSKSVPRNDGLPSYEEAIGLGPSQPSSVTPAVGQVNATNQCDEVNERSHGRHRHRRRNRHNHGARQNDAGAEEDGGHRRHRRRGFRRGRHSNRTKRDQTDA